MRLDIPTDTKTQSADLVLHADGKATKITLPLDVKLGNDLTGQSVGESGTAFAARHAERGLLL